MRISLATILNSICIGIGLLWSRGPLWIPILGLAMSLITTLTKEWVASDRIGTAVSVSIIIKAIFALIGFIAMLSQLSALGLIGYWLLT
jgi:hypothetical protein